MKAAAEKIVQLNISNDITKSHEPLPADKQQRTETLLSNAKEIDGFLAANDPRMGKGKNPKEVQSNISVMEMPIKKQCRRVSFLNTEQKQANYLDFMKENIDSAEGRRLYSRRMWTIVPAFGNITSNNGLDRLSLRGERKGKVQWLMFCMVHNIEKLWENAEQQHWVMN